MTWFTAKLIFIIEQEEHTASAQFDEQIRLIEANDSWEAMEKAETIAHREEQEFLNCNGKTVIWKLIGIPELQNLGDLKSGKEVYSQSPETEETEAYLEYVKRRYQGLKSGLVSLHTIA